MDDGASSHLAPITRGRNQHKEIFCRSSRLEEDKKKGAGKVLITKRLQRI